MWEIRWSTRVLLLRIQENDMPSDRIFDRPLEEPLPGRGLASPPEVEEEGVRNDEYRRQMTYVE